MSVNFSYPHPVLGNGDDIDSKALKPGVTFKSVSSDESVAFNITGLETEHSDLNAYLKKLKAAWHIRIICRNTYLRENFTTYESEWTHTFSGEDLVGIVYLEINLICLQQIPDYSPLKMHEDYGGAKFTINSGELLAVGPRFSCYIEKSFDPLKAPVASFFKVLQGDFKTGPFKVDFEGEYIEILFSETDWSQYFGIKDRVPAIIHSSVVLPVLMQAIMVLDENSSSLWAGRLNDILIQKDLDISNPIETAQQLLGLPIQRTFDKLNSELDMEG